MYCTVSLTVYVLGVLYRSSYLDSSDVQEDDS